MTGKSGQGTTEMLFVLPLLLMVAGGTLFVVYTFWQGVRVQQAANLAARIQGMERVGGGRSVQDIEHENGNGPGEGDPDPTGPGASGKFTAKPKPVASGSVYGKFYQVVKDMFPHAKDQTYVPPPDIGQNVDHVKVVRVIDLPKVPFMKWSQGHDQIKLEGNAYGGEDTFMYGLPRWGRTSGTGEEEWRRLVRDGSKD